jgi:transketolase
VPQGVREHFRDGIGRRGRQLRKAWFERFASYRTKYPQLADEIDRMQKRELPKGWDVDLPSFAADPKGLASRDASGKVLNAIARNHPWLIGGAADLAPSTKTRLTFEGAGDLEADKPGERNLHFGVREHAMGAILNGVEGPCLRSGVPYLLRLHETADPPRRLDGDSGRLRVHP